jgi:N-formylglutamate deformylase
MKLYNLFLPKEVKIPLLASLPHSGTYIPQNVRRQFKKDPPPILAPVDWHLDKLYDFLPELGITMIQATHSRYVVNLNRGLQEPLFGTENTSVISCENCFKSPLYDCKVDVGEVDRRIKEYYLPYHRKLVEIIDQRIREFGKVYMLDLHGYYAGPEVDICLGNVNETTCSELLVGSFEKELKKHEFSVVRNEKWLGGYITRYYGSMENVEALQIELRFPAYLDRESFEEEEITEWDSDKFRDSKKRMRNVFSDVLSELMKNQI